MYAHVQTSVDYTFIKAITEEVIFVTEAAKVSSLLGCLIFMGILFGGYLTLLVSKKLKIKHNYINLFCGGLLMGVITFDLIPESLDHLDSLGVFIGISAGALLILTIDRFFHRFNHSYTIGVIPFVLMIFALYLHSIPTGLALGMNIVKEELSNSFFAAAVVLHHVPEGVIIMAAIIHNKIKFPIFWVSCALLSLTVGFNILIGQNLPSVSLKLYTLVTGAAIGTLSYVAFYEILWKSLKSVSLMRVFFTLTISLASLKAFMFILSIW